MVTARLGSRHAVPGAVAALLALLPVASQAESPPNQLQIADQPAEQRLVLSLGPIPASADASSVGDARSVIASGRFPRAAMLHGFHAEAFDSAGHRIQGGSTWRVAIFTCPAADRCEAGVQLLANLGADARDVSLAKPLGYRVDAADSILLLVAVGAAAADSQQPLRLILTLLYEPLDGRVSRLGVVPMLAVAARPGAEAEPVASRVWEWIPAIGGRMLAIAGPALATASELVLEDAASGAVLWRTTVPHGAGGYAQASQIVRLGVAVQAGAAYRLTALYTDPVGLSADEHVLALVLPCGTHAAAP